MMNLGLTKSFCEPRPVVFGVEEIRLASSVGTDQKSERSEGYVTSADTLVVGDSHPRDEWDGIRHWSELFRHSIHLAILADLDPGFKQIFDGRLKRSATLLRTPVNSALLRKLASTSPKRTRYVSGAAPASILLRMTERSQSRTAAAPVLRTYLPRPGLREASTTDPSEAKQGCNACRPPSSIRNVDATDLKSKLHVHSPLARCARLACLDN